MKISHIAHVLGKAQVASPRRFLIIATLTTVISGLVASGIVFNSSFEALLPKDSPKLDNVNQVRSQTGGTRQVVAVIKGKDPEKRLAYAKKLAERLRKSEDVRFVDVEFPVEFFKDRGLWLMDPETLDELIPALEEAVRIAKWQANPMNLGLTDEAKDKAELEAAWGKVDEIVNKNREDIPFSKVLTSKDGSATFVLIVPRILYNDIEQMKRFLGELLQTFEDTKPEAFGVTVEPAGTLGIMLEQNRTMVSDLRAASTLAFVLGIVVVALTLRRVMAPFLIGISLLFGVTWTFALARLTIGQVNIITGFLVAVLIGLGIDFGIHLFVRFEQALRLRKKSIEDAVRESVEGTLPPALTSALTTAGTFFSFSWAEFRGFSEFGIIAGSGVLLTLLSSFLVLPPLLVLHAKIRSGDAAVTEKEIPKQAFINRKIALAVSLAFIGVAVFGGLGVGDIEFKNNFRELRGKSEATELADWVDANLGAGFNPAIFLAGSVEDASRIKAQALRQQKEGMDGRASRIARVFTISDVVPHNVEVVAPKIAALKDILMDRKLDRAEEKGGKRAEQLKLARRMVRTEPFGPEDIPEVFKRRLTTVKGDKYLVFVWPDKRNDSDLEASSWEDEVDFLSSSLDEKGITHEKADETLVLAWVYRTILKDGLPLFLVAVAVVMAFLLIDVRSIRRMLLIALPLAVGMLGFAAVLELFDLSINMFNMIVLPSIIGIGVDNAVHIYHRYKVEGEGSLRLVLRTTGMAAFLASVTTGIGFGSNLVSHNVGLQTLGLLAIIGISATFVSATIFFPCFLSLLEKSNR